jgi:hypothetical protein
MQQRQFCHLNLPSFDRLENIYDRLRNGDTPPGLLRFSVEYH